MKFKVDSDIWFIFFVLFVAALALFVFAYVAIIYFTRIKQLKRSKLRHKRKQDNFKRLEDKSSERKITDLQEDNQKLHIDLKNDLILILQSKLKAPNLLPFFSNFEKIHPDFGQSLQKIIPSITANELKLCAFLRLNLSSKEISLLLNITPESVNKARYRLRKKMELNSTEDLFTFLSNV